MDVTAYTQITQPSCLIHCMEESSPYPGIVIQTPTAGADSFSVSRGNNTSQMNGILHMSQRTKIIIVKNGTNMKVYNSNNYKGDSYYNFTSVNKTLLLGAYQTDDGTKGRYFTGTIHEFVITNTVMTNEQINAYLGVNVATN